MVKILNSIPLGVCPYRAHSICGFSDFLGSAAGVAGNLGSIGSGIGAVTGAISGLGSLIGIGGNSQEDMAKKQMEFQAQQAELSRKFQKEMTEYQNEWNKQSAIEMFNMENEYNTPAAQAQRLAEAGINPIIALGGSNTAAGLASQNAAQGSVAPSGAMASGVAGLPNSRFGEFSQIAQAVEALSKAANLGLDTTRGYSVLQDYIDQVSAESGIAQIEAKFREEVLRKGLQLTDSQIEKIDTELEYLYSLASNVQADTNLKVLESELYDVKKNILEADLGLKKSQKIWLDKTLDATIEKIWSEVKNNVASAADHNSNVRLHGAQTRYYTAATNKENALTDFIKQQKFTEEQRTELTRFQAKLSELDYDFQSNPTVFASRCYTFVQQNSAQLKLLNLSADKMLEEITKLQKQNRFEDIHQLMQTINEALVNVGQLQDNVYKPLDELSKLAIIPFAP